MEIKIFPGWEAVVTRVLHFSTLEHPVPVAGGSRLGRSCLSTLRQFSSLPKQGCTHQNAAPPPMLISGPPKLSMALSAPERWTSFSFTTLGNPTD